MTRANNNTADVTPTNISKPLCANPTPKEYATIRNNNQTLTQKQLDQSVGLQQLSRFGISNQISIQSISSSLLSE